MRVAELLEVVEEHLLDPDLDVNALLRLSGQRNKNVSTLFATEMGLAPKAYGADENRFDQDIVAYGADENRFDQDIKALCPDGNRLDQDIEI